MERSQSLQGRFAVALLLSAIGGLFKLYGGARYGSLAVLVDGVTCVANLVAGAAVLRMIQIARRPPDVDHAFGHGRFVYSGILILIVTYSIAAGISISALILRPPGSYEVLGESGVYALVGGVFYGGAIYFSSRAGVAGRSFAGFTGSELLESFISAGSAFGGAYVNSFVDYMGALIISGYIFVEIYHYGLELHKIIVDWTNPRLHELVRGVFEKRGFKVVSLRLRLFEEDKYVGDIMVEPMSPMPPDVAELLAWEAQEEVKERFNTELSVSVRRAGAKESINDPSRNIA